jgi:hypothetical protein
VEEWSCFIKGINHCGVFISDEEDKLAQYWNGAFGDLTTKLAYKVLFAGNGG